MVILTICKICSLPNVCFGIQSIGIAKQNVECWLTCNVCYIVGDVNIFTRNNI